MTRLLLTASGGPFRDMPADQLWSVTPEQALNHPTWKMGQRITIDSATMMNKGFEVIEACWLFDLAPSEVEVVVHPQSSVHAMVEYNDGSVIAQASATDMRMPIQYALTYPAARRRRYRGWTGLLPGPGISSRPIWSNFLSCDCPTRLLRQGGSATCTLNAADEIAVGAFLEGRIPFPAIAQTIEETLSQTKRARTGDNSGSDRDRRSVAGDCQAGSRGFAVGGVHGTGLTRDDQRQS